MTISVARLVSIAGHPAVLMPIAAMVASPGRVAGAALFVSVACACVVVGYTLYKARRGHWVHVDASVPEERAEFNSRVGLGLLAAAAALWLGGLHVGVPVVVGLSGLVVLVGHLFRRVAKLSLHVAFAVLAVFLVWPDQLAVAALAAVAVAVAWSRIALRRHVRADIVLGALTGASAGVVFHAAMAWLAT